MKAVTFSFDDGTTQDIRLIDLLNKYNLKSTFNLNSGLLAQKGLLFRDGQRIAHYKLYPEHVRPIYEGHEVASHTVNHPDLTALSEDKIVYQVEEDRKRLSELVGYEIVGFAYPCGYVDQRVISVLKKKTGVKYARSVRVTENYLPETDLYDLAFTTRNFGDNFLRLAEDFVNLKTDEPRIFSVWGHAYEFDWKKNWHVFEEFCKIISGHEDIFYGTNSQIFLNGK